MTATDDVDPDTRYAVGIDVGDGESCILWLDTTDPAAEAQVYERARPAERVVLTALARHRDSHEPVFGEAALLTGDAIQFSVNLKRIPKASLSTPDMVLFAQAFLDEFFAAHPDVRADCQILVGYPTGWPDSARDLYRRFLRTSDIPLALLPESQSALVHVWDLQERDIDNVLVVDIGSSTVDVTMVTDLNPLNIELGTELGCGDIDKQLAQMATSALADAPAFVQAMEHNDASTLLRLACRRAKEAQFSGQSLRLHDLQEALRPRLGPVVELASGWLRAQDIPHLVEKHWAGRFRDLLREVREKLARTPEVVVLTGGGSRMPVTRRICAEVSPRPCSNSTVRRRSRSAEAWPAQADIASRHYGSAVTRSESPTPRKSSSHCVNVWPRPSPPSATPCWRPCGAPSSSSGSRWSSHLLAWKRPHGTSRTRSTGQSARWWTGSVMPTGFPGRDDNWTSGWRHLACSPSTS